MKIYKVGGCVRDKILGLEPKDTDYVIVGATPQDIKDIENLNYKQVGADFPVFIHPKTGEEYALARIERKTGSGYNGFSFETENVSLEEDLKRRDLTINSIAINEDENFIDPFNGISDIENKILRPTSEAFKEDPVRILRVARFMARFGYEWNVSQEIFQYALDLKEELKTITKERKRLELEKAMKEPFPELFFLTLKNLKVMDIVFPELYSEKNFSTLVDKIKELPVSCRIPFIFFNISNTVELKENYRLLNCEVELLNLLKDKREYRLLLNRQVRNKDLFIKITIKIINNIKTEYLLKDLYKILSTMYLCKISLEEFTKLWESFKNIKLPINLVEAEKNEEIVSKIKDFIREEQETILLRYLK